MRFLRLLGTILLATLAIAVVALIFVGPKRLPEVMKQAGKLFVHVRRTANDVKSSFDQVVREAEDDIRKQEAEQMRQLMSGAAKPATTVQAINAGVVDAGMTGDYESVIGMNRDEPLDRFMRRIPQGRFEPANGAPTLSGVAVESDDKTGLAVKVGPLRIGGRLEEVRPSFWC